MALPKDIIEPKWETLSSNRTGVFEQDGVELEIEGPFKPERLLDENYRQLFARYIRDGAQPRNDWKCGVEAELFGFEQAGWQRLGPDQIDGLVRAFAASPERISFENGLAIESQLATGGRITVEPGGQIEFSSAPRHSLVELERDLRSYVSRLSALADQRDLRFVAIGFDPLRSIEEQRWVPKQRYRVMRPYLATRGSRAWDMMSRTCAIQVNVDFSSDEDLARKFIVGNRLGPVVGAMFANSPFENGAPSGFKSLRQEVWLRTDSDRAGISPLAVNGQFTVEEFVEYMLEVPMLFIRRQGEYLDSVTGERFSAFLENGQVGPAPIFQDWTDHMSTVFTDARLKQYIELRSVDGGNLEMMMAAQALWKGLLYDAGALKQAMSLSPNLERAEWGELQSAVARHGLQARACGVNIAGLAKELVELAVDGLRRVAPDEVKYLGVLEQLVCREERTPADILLRNWSGSWHGSITHLMDYLRITA